MNIFYIGSKLIALPKTNANLVATCYNYGLLNTVYTQTGDEIITIPELHKAFMNYKRITKGTLFYIKFYSDTQYYDTAWYYDIPRR